MRHYHLRGGDIPVLRVHRQCPLVILVKLRLRQGKALGSEEGKVSGSGHCYEQQK
jgi:hypothetical protein